MNEKKVKYVFGYQYFQMIRAILLATSVVYMRKVFVAQVFSIAAYTLASIIYVGITRPFETNFDNSMNQVNEFTTMITLYHMMCFTDFGGDSETIDKMGYSLNYFLGASIVLNLSFIVFDMIKTKINKCKLNRLRKKNLKIY